MPPDTAPVIARRDHRVATAVFVLGTVIAIPVLAMFGDGFWFTGDDWSFLGGRSAASMSDLLESHDGHWTTLPILQWRLFYRLFGYDYFPFQLAVIASHLAVAAALWLVMIRSGINGARSTLFALVFVYFGSGSSNILSAFQTTLNGSLFFGLVHLLLADAPEPTRRKDLLGLLAGALALMCSGVAIGMVVGVGVATLLSRGWRAALLHTAPLAAFYAVWYLEYSDGARDVSGLTDIAHSAALGVRQVFFDLAQWNTLGIVLMVATAIGLTTAWITERPDGGPRLSSAAGLLAAAVVLYIAFSYFRVESRGVEYVASQKRYTHVGAAVLIPTIAVAIEALWARFRPAGVAALLLVIVGVPGNLGAFADLERGLPRGAVYAIPDVDFVSELPADHRLFGQRYLTIEMLTAARDAGRLPAGQSSAADRELAEFTLLLDQKGVVAAATDECQPVSDTASFTLEPGDAIGFEGTILAREHGSIDTEPIRYRSVLGGNLLVLRRPLTIDIWRPGSSSDTGEVCVLRQIPTITPGRATVTEGDTRVEIPVTLSYPLEIETTVEWETIDDGRSGTATPDEDYIAASGTLAFAAGQTEAFVSITVLDDAVADDGTGDGEWVVVRFHDPSPGAALDMNFFGLGVGVIEDDD